MLAEIFQCFRCEETPVASDGEQSESQLQNKTIAIQSELPSDGSFLFYHFINLFIGPSMSKLGSQKKTNGNVVLVACERPEVHYQTVASRLGISLKPRVPTQPTQFHCLTLYEILNSSKVPGQDLWSVDAKSIGQICTETLNRIVNDFAVDGRLLLIWDNISCLEDLGFSMAHIRQLFLNIQKIVYAKSGIFLFCTDTNHGLISSYAAHFCDYRLLTQPIGTGFSKDVTGRLIIEKRAQRTVPERRDFHYRLGDRSVKLMAPGLAQPIL